MVCLEAHRQTTLVQVSVLEVWPCLWRVSSQGLAVVRILGTRYGVSGVSQCPVMYQVNGQTGELALFVYVPLSKLLGDGNLQWFQLVTQFTH